MENSGGDMMICCPRRQHSACSFPGGENAFPEQKREEDRSEDHQKIIGGSEEKMTEETKTKQIHLNEYQRAAVLDESPACVVNANVGS